MATKSKLGYCPIYFYQQRSYQSAKGLISYFLCLDLICVPSLRSNWCQCAIMWVSGTVLMSRGSARLVLLMSKPISPPNLSESSSCPQLSDTNCFDTSCQNLTCCVWKIERGKEKDIWDRKNWVLFHFDIMKVFMSAAGSIT